MKILALKIYANTQKSYRDGVPRLLDILDEADASGSFFFGMGSESSGSAFRKLFTEAPLIVDSSPGILRDASKRGQDCGIYGWNPFEWETRLDKLQDTTLEAAIRRAVEMFTRKTGVRPDGFAAPGWQVNYMSLRVQDAMHFKYCSDTFGFFPYLPRLSWKTFSTLQIPDTMPPVESILRGANAAQMQERFQELEAVLPFGLTVLPMNAGIGGTPELRESLRNFLLRCRDEGVRFSNLGNVSKILRTDTLPVCEIVSQEALGFQKPVSVQVVA